MWTFDKETEEAYGDRKKNTYQFFHRHILNFYTIHSDSVSIFTSQEIKFSNNFFNIYLQIFVY